MTADAAALFRFAQVEVPWPLGPPDFIAAIPKQDIPATGTVDYRYVDAGYIGPAWHFAMLDIPFRILVPCVVSLLLIAILQLILTRRAKPGLTVREHAIPRDWHPPVGRDRDADRGAR